VAALFPAPLRFYLQAMVQAVLGDGIGSARLTSTLMGLIAVLLVFDLGRICFGDHRGALWAAMIFLPSRAFLFPATTARPDMTAAMLGLLAIWLITRDNSGHLRSLLASGIAAGLSLLAHPIGIVPGTLVGLWCSIHQAGQTWAPRATGLLISAGAAIGALGLWLPLIALHPDLFWAQFSKHLFHPNLIQSQFEGERTP
jgi:4-amino-4-deoxy-L-arabinose transferase-like glycosyltransferase